MAEQANRQKDDSIYSDCGIFEYTDSGFKVKTENGSLEIKWQEIETIFGYKADRITFDDICADVFCDNSKSFSITEETPGWSLFIKKVKETFSQIDPSWDFEIATPVFETKLTLVYDRRHRTLDDAVKRHYKD